MGNVAAIQDETQEVPAEIHKLRWANLRKRKGRFNLYDQMVGDFIPMVMAIMGECFVTRCEHRWDADVFEYCALSWQFREVHEGEMAPEYVWEKNADGTWDARETEVKS